MYLHLEVMKLLVIKEFLICNLNKSWTFLEYIKLKAYIDDNNA